MTGAPLVGAGENCIDDTQLAGGAESLGRQPFAGWHDAAKHCSRMFQGSDNRGTNRDDTTT